MLSPAAVLLPRVAAAGVATAAHSGQAAWVAAASQAAVEFFWTSLADVCMSLGEDGLGLDLPAGHPFLSSQGGRLSVRRQV